MEGTEEYFNERLDHLGIVAGVCQEVGLAGWLDAQDPGSRKQVSVGTATVAMLLCLLIYRFADFRLRSRLAETQQTIPDQAHKPTDHPTMRWVFQCFEGIELLHIQTATTSRVLVVRLQPLHRRILHLLGPPYEKFSVLSG
jgi:Domain of unknown function (DUF4277)